MIITLKYSGSVSAFQRYSQNGAYPLIKRRGEGGGAVVAIGIWDGIVDVGASALLGDGIGDLTAGTDEAILLLAIRISEERVFQHT